MIDMKNKQKEFASIQEEAKDLLSRIKNEGIDISKTLGEEGLNTIKKAAHEGTVKAEEVVECLEDFIKNKPFLSAVMAFGAGIIIARIASWTSHR